MQGWQQPAMKPPEHKDKTMTTDFDFSIDEDQLDKEWLGQPELANQIGRELADATLNLEQAKVDLDLVTAELSSAIRENPQDYGLDKITEKAVESAILQCRRYTKQQKELLRCKHTVDLLRAASNACEHRKKALEKLVDLWSQSYFSSPRATTEEAQAMERKAIMKKTKPKKRGEK